MRAIVVCGSAASFSADRPQGRAPAAPAPAPSLAIGTVLVAPPRRRRARRRLVGPKALAGSELALRSGLVANVAGDVLSISRGQHSRALSAGCPVERSPDSRPGQEATRLGQRVHEYQMGLSERLALTPRGGTRDCRGLPKNRHGIAAARSPRRRGSRGAFHGATKVGWSRHVHCGRPSRWQTRVGRLTKFSWRSHDPVGSELSIKQALNVGRAIRGRRQWKEP